MNNHQSDRLVEAQGAGAEPVSAEPASAAAEEARRLGALRRYAVLDTAPEQALNDLVLLAASLCEVPIASISLVDEHREWYAAQTGLATLETPREFSFCAQALRHPEVLTVPDATQDERFAGNPMVTGEPGIRFYAGAPLRTPEGLVLGSLCVIDRVPRALSPVQEQALRVLAQQVMAQFELRRQARELAKSEQFLRAIIEAEPECVKLIGRDGSLEMMNRAGLDMVQAETLAEVTGQKIYAVLEPPQLDRLRKLMKRVFRGQAGILEYEIVGLKGRRLWLETHAAPLRDEQGRVSSLLAITRNITARKAEESARRMSEARYRRLFEFAPEGILIADAETRYLDANPSICRLLGYTHGEIVGMRAAEIADPAEQAFIAPSLAAVQAGGDLQREWRLRRKDGSALRVEVVATQMPDGNLMTMVRDVTERRRTEERFHRLVESNVQGVVFWRANGEVPDANDAFLRIVGYSRADLEAGLVNWRQLTPPAFAQADEHAMEEVLQRGECTPFEKEYLRADGSSVPVLVGAAAFKDNPKEGVGFVLDLTELKKLERQFLRMQRMESIGILAGGIAHDLNNALGPIIMSLELLGMKFTDHASRELLGIISNSAQRGADMVRQVLSFARGVEGRRMDVQIDHLARDIEKIANETFLKHVQVRTTMPRGLWSILGDSTQLHQVLLNLCVNARDAMPEGGTVQISASNVTLDQAYATLHPEAKPGPYVCIQVADTGSGMSPAVVEKAFDLFFTTKALGQGTGLGLSTSLGIVKSHGGFIQVETELGRGSTFSVYLPAQDESAPARTAETSPELPLGQDELILVVDDEASVRKITQQTLEAFGYRVIVASDGAQALALYTAHRSEIALVFTDMMMPVMDGPTAIRHMMEIDPSVRIIATSGLTSHESVAQSGGLGTRSFLQKPYAASILLKMVRQVLDEPMAGEREP